MRHFCKSLIFFVALLPLASLEALRANAEATKEVVKEDSDVPIGYEEAAGSTKEKAKEESQKQEVAKPEKEELKEGKKQKEAKEKKLNIPVGYEDSDEAGKGKKKARRRAVARPVPAALAQEVKAQEAKALVDVADLFADNAQLKALVPQMRQQLSPFFAAELSFAKTVCQPNPTQLQKMKSLATPALEKIIRAMAIQQAPQMRIGVRFQQFQQVQQKPKDVFGQFETAAIGIVSQVFTEKVVNVYQQELDHRKAFQAKSGAMALVAHLDTKFRLSSAQRKSLTDSFQQEWQRSWLYYLQIMSSNPQFFPPVTDQAIVPHLNDAQVKQWKARQRHNLGHHWQHQINQGGLFQNPKQAIDWFQKPQKNPVNNVQGFGFIQILEGAVPGAILVEAVEEEQEK